MKIWTFDLRKINRYTNYHWPKLRLTNILLKSHLNVMKDHLRPRNEINEGRFNMKTIGYVMKSCLIWNALEFRFWRHIGFGGTNKITHQVQVRRQIGEWKQCLFKTHTVKWSKQLIVLWQLHLWIWWDVVPNPSTSYISFYFLRFVLSFIFLLPCFILTCFNF